MVRRANAGTVLTVTETELPAPEVVAESLRSLLEDGAYDGDAVAWSSFESYTARASTRLMVEALDRAYARGKPTAQGKVARAA
jgi:hypothetical protein